MSRGTHDSRVALHRVLIISEFMNVALFLQQVKKRKRTVGVNLEIFHGVFVAAFL